MHTMLIFDVFGRHIGIRREGGRWLAYRVDLNENKFSRLRDVVIPDGTVEEDIPGWLDDIFHEMATARHPEVRRIAVS